ncbi:MAG: imelysin family protein [Alphaproteobacteria bacterium]|nr:imelysin family protein [Alphaproteobacteria bacterium]
MISAALFPAAAFADPAPGPASNAATESLAFADNFAVPRFKAVQAAAHAQESAWITFCADRARGNVESLKKAYNDLGDAWSDVEIVRIGPAAAEMRVERFNWWLDRTDATGKALTGMLAVADANDLMPEKLASGSVAGQGLPVIERLLYPAAFKGKDGARRCAVGSAVARGQAIIADQIVGDWTAADGTRAALADNTRWKFAFADAKEAASVMLTDLAAGLEGLKDFKVPMVFHDAANAKAPRLTEAWRSGRTLRDIGRNLAAIREGLTYFTANATAERKQMIAAAFDDAQKSLAAVEAAKGPARVDAAKAAIVSFTALMQTAKALLPEATGLTLGFNNLDGD